MKIKLFLLIILFNTLSAAIPAEDAWVLDQFLRYTFTEESFGYVYEKEKPISGTGYYTQDFPFPGTLSHKRNTFLREGSRVWHQNFSDAQTDWLLIDSQNNKSQKQRILNLIYLPLLEKIIEDNLVLFKSILGPDTSTEKLISDLKNPQLHFPEQLKNSNILIGIVLGYGSNNSILVSRTEALGADLALEAPPLKHVFFPQHKFSPPFPIYREKSTPNSGFASIEEELSALVPKAYHNSNSLLEEKPNLLFGWEKGCEETQKRIVRLEKTQKDIQALLAEPNFADNVILKLTGKNIPLHPRKPNHYPPLARAIANSCFEIWNNCTPEFYRGILAGMTDSNNNHESRMQTKVKMNENQQTHLLRTSLATKKESESYIASLDSGYRILIPNKLAYKVTKEGNGSVYQNQRRVKLHLALTMGPYLQPLYHSNGVQEFDLTETIPGLAHSLQGMKEGERREVIIHSDYGYGLYTNLERGQWMTATVEFVKGLGDETIEMPEPLQEEIPSEEQMAQIQYEAGYAMGYHVWNHYKKHPAPSFHEVREILAQGPHELNITPEERQQLDRLHIEIYSQD